MFSFPPLIDPRKQLQLFCFTNKEIEILQGKVTLLLGPELAPGGPHGNPRARSPLSSQLRDVLLCQVPLHYFSVLGNARLQFSLVFYPPTLLSFPESESPWQLPFLLSGSLWGFSAVSTAFLSDFPNPPSSLLSPLLLPFCGSSLPLPASYPTAASNPKHFFWPCLAVTFETSPPEADLESWIVCP